MRNASVLTIAPTGTISRIAGCSSSIEPIFAFQVISKILDGEIKRHPSPVPAVAGKAPRRNPSRLLHHRPGNRARSII